MTTKTTKKPIPTILGMTAFLTATGLDYVLEGPNKPKTRPVSVQVTKRRKELQLDGKAISFIDYVLDANGEPVKVQIQWGAKTLVLGRRSKASGDVSFYRSLEPSNKVAGPRTAAEIIAVLNTLKK